MSKGSNRRPTLVDEETFEERWEKTFSPMDVAQTRVQVMKAWAQDLLAKAQKELRRFDGS